MRKGFFKTVYAPKSNLSATFQYVTPVKSLFYYVGLWWYVHFVTPLVTVGRVDVYSHLLRNSAIQQHIELKSQKT